MNRAGFLRTIYNYFGLEEAGRLTSESENALHQFLESSDCTLLKSYLTSNNELGFDTKIGSVSFNSVVFYKTKAQALNDADWMKDVGMITLPHTPVESLYLSLRHVYSPLLLADNNAFTAKLQQSIVDLESSLRVIAYGKGEDENVNVILSIEDEAEYWGSVERGRHPRKQKEAAAAFRDIFQQLAEELRSLQTNAMSEIQECMENAAGFLDDVWRHSSYEYPQARMLHMFHIVGNLCITSVQSFVTSLDIWNIQGGTKDSELLLKLRDASKAVGAWIDACTSLTNTYWPNHSLHPWSNEPFVPHLCVMFRQRLDAIFDIRCVHHQLNKLLTPDEQRELNTQNMFEAFKKINIWICTPGYKQVWDNAVSYTTSVLKPAELRVAEKLKPRLHNSSTKQMLNEFMRYKSLIERPVVKQSLHSELESFVDCLGGLLKEIRSQMESDELFEQNNYRAPEMPVVVQQIQWAKQMESRAKGIEELVENLLSEFEGCAELSRLTKTTLNDLKGMYTRLYDDWSRQLQMELKEGTLQLSVDKPVVEFSARNSMMIVQFEPKLATVEAAARALAALGLPAPPNVRQAIDQAAQFLQHAHTLQQVASFHNTLGERMIPSTRPLMLQAALALSSLVQQERGVCWRDAGEVAKYADTLKQSVAQLETQNSYLTGQHIAIRNIVAQLMDTDLLGKQAEWKKSVRSIREIIEQVEQKGLKNTGAWRAHWDQQIYKALECQYVKTLLALHTHFPPVRVDLVCRGGKIILQPPLEELRVQHYSQLRRLVSLPAQFLGVQDVADVTKETPFVSIVHKHSWLGNKAVKQLESALAGVERVRVEWCRRAALGAVDSVEALCREHLREPQHWADNFKACKAYGQAVAKMTFDDERVDWISIGTASLRREFDAQVRNLWACLISSLQGSCQEDMAVVDSFVANAQVTLEKTSTPKNARELSEISAAQRVLQEKFPEMERTVEMLKLKQQTLRSWGGDQAIESTVQEWVKVQNMIASKRQLFEHQAEIVKSSLSGEWGNLCASLSAWASRWALARAKLTRLDSTVTYEEARARSQQVSNAQAQWSVFRANRDDILSECEKFGMKPEVSAQWREAEEMLTEDANTWQVFTEYDESFSLLGKQEWAVFQKRLHILDEFVSSWSGRMEPYTPVTLYLQQQIDKYKDVTPLLRYVRGTDMTERHWREVLALLELGGKRPESLLLKDLLAVAHNIKKHIKTLQKISSAAASESAIRGALNELELWYAGARFILTYYTDKKGQAVPIIKDFKEILNKLEEQQWVVWSLRGGEGDGGAAQEACAVWETRLLTAVQLTKSMHRAQRRWLYLEPILSGESGEPGSKFRLVDGGYRAVARALESDARLSALLHSPRLQPTLDSVLAQLAACQQSLETYIDDKRHIFPRFYFLSDDDLLELLGQARAGAAGRELVLQSHLRKLFPGITGVTLGPNCMSVVALNTHYEDRFPLDKAVDIDCPVEVWLKNLEDEMRSSLKNAVLSCLLDKTFQYQNAFSFPTQILCLAQNVRFTEQAERSITANELHKLKDNIERECKHYIEVDPSEDEGERIKKRALILQCSYYLNVLQTLIDNNVTAISHWLWQKHLRFYLLSNKDIVARMGLAQISYSYEYLGIDTGQFVRTDLTDKCFLILTQAFHLGLVGNPFGPAGTGKTESVKALGGLVGRLVLVFNCDEAMDATCMGRLLSGLARCGAWGCFDEFNRLTADTLALVSHQFASLLGAMSGGGAALLNGKEVSVSDRCGVLATLNPAGRGYGGRRALPAAVTRLLRPAAAARPPAAPLAHHLLAARALHEPRQVAYALAHVFSMAQDLLSWQQHYDWGLRALKTVVGSCGSAVEAARARSGGALSEEQQRAIVLRATRLNTMSKLTRADAHRFDAILSMSFPGVAVSEEGESDLDLALTNSYQALGLVYKKEQAHKCKELHEQLQQRMGVVIVGPPGSGKSTVRQLLKNALNSMGKNVVEHVICPKAMSRSLLMGHIDHDTRQWTDGVISSVSLEVSNQSSDVWSWVVLDGDVEPEWVESLNSVLDDNRLLTLPSGWRVQFPPGVNFLLETHSLRHASPATVSRTAVLLLGDEDSCATEALDSWCSKLDADSEHLRSTLPLLRKTMSECLEWSRRHRNEFLQTLYSFAIVKQVLVQFEEIVQSLKTEVMNMMSPEDIVSLAFRRGIVPALKAKAAEKFMEEVCGGLGGHVEVTETMEAAGWRDDIYLSPRLARASVALTAAARHSHTIIVGTDACAKNLIAEHIIKESTDKLLISIHCTPVLEPSNIIEELKRNKVIRTGSVWSKSAASGGVVLLVKSLHRARVDAWGTSAVQAFILQLIQYGGFWDRVQGEGAGEAGGVQWSSVPGVQVVMTLNSCTLCPRLASSSVLIPLREPDDDELPELAAACLTRAIASKEISGDRLRKVTDSMLLLYKEATETFTSQPHYRWNTAHLTNWCDNVQWYKPKDLESLLQAISAEADCIFRNRLITDEDTSQFDAMKHRYIRTSNMEALYYTPKLQRDGVYMELTDYNDWCQSTQKIINQCVSESEQNVFGECGVEVCSELATLCSAIARSVCGGVVVCVGSAGGGRRAAARIVSTALPAALYSIRDSRDFNTQLRNAITNAGSENNKTIVVLEESVASAMAGAVEALFRATSLSHLPVGLQPSATQRGDTIHLHNVKKNLGVVMLLDQSDPTLASLMERYPMLHRRCRLVWTARWCRETLRRMPQLVVQRIMKENISEAFDEEDGTTPIDGFVSIYSRLRSDAALAPCRYINLVKTYYHISKKKKHALLKRQETLQAGVAALRKARTEVNELKQDAARQQTMLSEKQQKATTALNQISATVTSATSHKEEMQVLKRDMESENAKLQVRKGEIESELASVEPVIAAARAAVGDIRTEALSEVRSMRAPPDVVRDVLEGVLRLMGIADTSWHSMKNFLAKRGVKEDIRCMDASQITAESLASVEKLLERRGASFEEKTAKRASAACAPLAAWVRANVAYASALQRVRPLQIQQRNLQKNLEDAEAQLTALSSGLQSVDERVAALKDQLNRYTKEGLEIEIKLNTANETIAKTESLVDKLSEEYDTWERDLQSIFEEIEEINVRSLLAAAYVVYLSDVPEDQCKDYMEEWSKGLGFDCSNFSVLNFLSSVEDQLKWSANGLPSDVSAVKNAVIVHQALQEVKCGFTPLIIDPDGDASSWLRSCLSEMPSDFIPQHSDKLNTAIQHATRSGKVLVVEQTSCIDEQWAGLLRGVSLSANALHPRFRLLLYSRDTTLPRRLHPSHRALLSVVDFTPKIEGLTDQLMNFALQHEKPDINEKMNALKVQKASLQKQQYELQENLLKDLSGNKDILQDANLLSSLASTRATSSTIAAALTEARTLERQMNSLYDKFRQSARRAAILLLAVREVSAGKYPLVSVPVETLVSIYIEALSRGKIAEDPESLDKEAVVKYVTSRIIERVVLSLHKQDKYTVILHILHRVYPDIIPKKLWDIFIGTVLNADDGAVRELISKLPWIPVENIPTLANLKAVAPELFDKLKLEDVELWKPLMISGDLNSVARLNLTPFERAVAVQAIRPESLYAAVSALVTSVLGASGGWRQSGGVEAGARWAAAGGGGTPRPILLLGAHAADQLTAHANQHKHNLIQVWVGSDEDQWRSELERALQSAGRGDEGGGGRGAWVALQVGAAPFSNHLQTFITTFCLQPMEMEFDAEFRLWIVSEEREIPPLIANTCVNLLLEAPEGVRYNVMQSLSAWGNFESQDVKVVRMVFCLALLHAIVQERRAYTPQGWTQWYEWEWGDVSAAFSAVTGGEGRAAAAGLCEALYGGRVANEQDAALLAAIIKENLGEQALAHAFTPRGLSITLPFSKQLQAYNSALSSFPLSDTPAQLGLASNARAAWDKKAGSYLLTTLRDLNAAISMSQRSEDTGNVKPILSLWRKQMSSSPFIKGDGNAVDSDGGGGWWGAVVRGEGSAAARAVSVVHRALASAARDPSAARTITHKTPEEWQTVWAGPDLLSRYVREICHRATAAAARQQQHRDADRIPREVELRSLFSPRRLLVALQASTAETLGCSPESLVLNAKWNCKPDGVESGCVVRGLQLEGAAWVEGQGCLAPASADAPPRVSAPPILLYYVQQRGAVSAAAGSGWAEVPVYSNDKREELLMHVHAPLASHFTPTTVVLNAVALLVAEV